MVFEKTFHSKKLGLISKRELASLAVR